MKCEIKCIKNDLKEDYKTLGLRTLSIIFLFSFGMSIALYILLSDYILIYTSIISTLVIFAYFTLLAYFTWKDAVEYCKKRKGKTQIDNMGIHHE